MDKNGDGGLDESELAGMAKRTGKDASQLLTEMDTNKDGKVDSGEMQTAMEKRRAASGQAPDAAGQFTTALMNILKQLQGGSTGGSDGSSDPSSDAFSKMDTDGDGKLSPAEFAAGTAKQKSDGGQNMESAAKEFTSSLMNLFNQLQGSGQGGGAANASATATASSGTTGQDDMVAQFQQALKNGFSFSQTSTTEMTTLQSIG
jgi:Ca2+-binding EF-hand superfamily protein